jgi:hypothetical protein
MAMPIARNGAALNHLLAHQYSLARSRILLDLARQQRIDWIEVREGLPLCEPQHGAE